VKPTEVYKHAAELGAIRTQRDRCSRGWSRLAWMVWAFVATVLAAVVWFSIRG